MLYLLTHFLFVMREYELNDANIDFKPDYHFGPKQASKRGGESVTERTTSRDLTIKLLQRYLEEPSCHTSTPVPDLEQVASEELFKIRIL